VVRAPASHQCGPGWISGVDHDSICGLRFFTVVVLAPGASGVPIFSLSFPMCRYKKINISQFQMDLDKLEEEAITGCTTAKSHLHFLQLGRSTFICLPTI